MTAAQTTNTTADLDVTTSPISWFEIPATDFARARAFYERLLDIELREERMGPAHLGVFPGSGPQMGGCIAVLPDYQPSSNGSIVYLRTAGDLQNQLDRAQQLGGAVLLPKTELPEDMGFYAHIRDCEGNRIGLHSMQ